MNVRLSILLLTLLALLLTACSQQAQAINGPLPPESTEAAVCPTPTNDTRLLTHAEHGYCLLYPIVYKVEKPTDNETALVIGGLLNAQDPRVSVWVEAADGRTAQAVADDLAAGMTGFSIERASVDLGGVEAIVLDKLPGQEMNRRVFAVHDGLMYQLTFQPADEGLGAPYQGMEELYELVVSSFTFIPPSQVTAPGEECLEANADTQSLTNEAHNYCIIYPTEYQAEQPNENETVLFVGSLTDVAHPKAFIKVQDAAGHTAQTLAEELVDQVEAAMPGYGVESTFGLTVGYEPAVVLENVPGQDISRQVVFMHGDRAYLLTFAPADASSGEVYAQVEHLYTTVVNSFRFLR